MIVSQKCGVKNEYANTLGHLLSANNFDCMEKMRAEE